MSQYGLICCVAIFSIDLLWMPGYYLRTNNTVETVANREQIEKKNATFICDCRLARRDAMFCPNQIWARFGGNFPGFVAAAHGVSRQRCISRARHRNARRTRRRRLSSRRFSAIQSAISPTNGRLFSNDTHARQFAAGRICFADSL